MFLTLCVCCLIGCQSFQAKSLSCSQSEFISYPLERNAHDALPSPPLNGEPGMTNPNLTRTLLPLSFTTVIISCCLFSLAFSLAIKSLPVISSCQPCLPAFLHVFCSNRLWAQWSVGGAHAKPDRQTALSTGCPFFPLARPITQSQYKHSFLWSTEPL